MVYEGRQQEEARGHHWVTESLVSCPSPHSRREHSIGQELRWQGLPQPEPLEQAHTLCLCLLCLPIPKSSQGPLPW